MEGAQKNEIIFLKTKMDLTSVDYSYLRTQDNVLYYSIVLLLFIFTKLLNSLKEILKYFE